LALKPIQSLTNKQIFYALDWLVWFGDMPKAIIVNNEPKFISKALNN